MRRQPWDEPVCEPEVDPSEVEAEGFVADPNGHIFGHEWYKDDGCGQYPSCLRCPLIKCQFEDQPEAGFGPDGGVNKQLKYLKHLMLKSFVHYLVSGDVRAAARVLRATPRSRIGPHPLYVAFLRHIARVKPSGRQQPRLIAANRLLKAGYPMMLVAATVNIRPERITQWRRESAA